VVMDGLDNQTNQGQLPGCHPGQVTSAVGVWLCGNDTQEEQHEVGKMNSPGDTTLGVP
jgi:hypothetical protein